MTDIRQILEEQYGTERQFVFVLGEGLNPSTIAEGHWVKILDDIFEEEIFTSIILNSDGEEILLPETYDLSATSLLDIMNRYEQFFKAKKLVVNASEYGIDIYRVYTNSEIVVLMLE